jgi:hypothetical protein
MSIKISINALKSRNGKWIEYHRHYFQCILPVRETAIAISNKIDAK